jgi:hypothetical protein
MRRAATLTFAEGRGTTRLICGAPASVALVRPPSLTLNRSGESLLGFREYALWHRDFDSDQQH